MNLERRRIEKIFSQINKIGSKGRNNELEYNKYIDDIVTRGDYDKLLQCLYYYYDIDTQKLNTVEDIKKKTWKDIILISKSSFETKLKKLYSAKGVYQTSFDIFKDDNTFLGQLRELSTYTDETRYYIKNRKYAKITGTRKAFIEVTKVGETIAVIIDDNNREFSEDQNLYNKYVFALNILLENNGYFLSGYVDVGYV